MASTVDVLSSRGLSTVAKFNLENRTCWDRELFVHIANQGAKIAYIRADLVDFRIHEASISGSRGQHVLSTSDSMRILLLSITQKPNMKAITRILNL